jgi:hypothetical protein
MLFAIGCFLSGLPLQVVSVSCAACSLSHAGTVCLRHAHVIACVPDMGVQWECEWVTLAPRPFFDLLYVSICFILTVVAYMTEYSILHNNLIVAWFHRNVYVTDKI